MLQISHAVVSFARQMFQNRVVVVTSGSMAGFPKTLLPSEHDRVAQAVSDIRMGIPVALSNGTERIVFLSAESVGDEKVVGLARPNPEAGRI